MRQLGIAKFRSLELVFGFLLRVHSNASINNMTATDLQDSHCVWLDEEQKFKDVLSDLIVYHEEIFMSKTIQISEFSEAVQWGW